MAKTKAPQKPRDAYPKLPRQPDQPAAAAKTHAVRETVESIVIAFVLAFLFRTFEAEAFVIPTGSMAPTLMGRHKDVDCPKCGYRYQVSASEEESDDPRGDAHRLCRRHVPDVPLRAADATRSARQRARESRAADIDFNVPTTAIASWSTSTSTRSATRSAGTWSCSSFPATRKMNYIKRLVGLPGETLRIFQGDMFVGDRRRNATRRF